MAATGITDDTGRGITLIPASSGWGGAPHGGSWAVCGSGAGAGDASSGRRPCLQAPLADRLLAAFTDAVGAVAEPSQRVLDVGQVLTGPCQGRLDPGALVGDGGALRVVLVVHVGVRRPSDDTVPITTERRDELQRRITICDESLLHSSHRPPSTPPPRPTFREARRSGCRPGESHHPATHTGRGRGCRFRPPPRGPPRGG